MDEQELRTGEGPTTVGARLKAAREAEGLSLEDVARQTRVPVRHLVQIEDGRLEGLPAAPYSSGFVKSYARAVGLDPSALSQQFRAEFDRAAREVPRVQYEPYEPADPARLPPRMLVIVAVVIAIVLVAGYAIWRSGVLTGNGPDARAQLAAEGGNSPMAATTPAPVANRAVAPAAARPAVTGGAVQLTALQPVWVKISERNGPTLFMGTLDQGKSYDVPAGAADPVIRTGRPEAIGVTVGGRPVAALGAPAHTIANVSLKAEALLSRSNAGAAASIAAPRTSEAPSSASKTATPPPAATGTATPSAFSNATAAPSAAQPQA